MGKRFSAPLIFKALSILMHFRCDQKCINWFAFTLPFWWIFDCPHWNVASCDVSWTLCTCYKQMCLQYFKSLFSFWYVFDCFWPSIQYNTYTSFHFDPLPIKFPNRSVFDENAQHVSVEGRPTCIEMKAFSNENVSVWKGPKPLEN